MKKLFAIITIFLVIKTNRASAQFPSDSANQTESKVIPYTLPDPLMMLNGKRVKDSTEWMKTQRAYIYQLFEKNVYGRFPRQKINAHYQIREESKHALNGIALRRQVRIYLKQSDTSVYIDVLMYLPANSKGKAPVFVGLNFNGNQAIQNDPAILANPGDETSRRTSSSRWPVKTIIENGFGLVTACYNDIEIDNKDGWKTGVRTKLQEDLKIKPEDWGAIGAWAWGLSRIMDYLETDKNVDQNKVAVMGHSRLGKTALWAGASDPRFDL
ncbi:MAG TPA: hypothetical protein VFF57_09180, partial [Hanamia sp.]|nr:hypothetical protein [Hanamia sp.]